MKALSMKAKWLKPVWFWKVRWLFLFCFSLALVTIPLIVALAWWNDPAPDGKAGLIIGVACGMVGFAGVNLIIELVHYAIRRVRLGRKLIKVYGKE